MEPGTKPTNVNKLTISHTVQKILRRTEDSFHPVLDWTPCEYATALAGEVGEACNIVKKLKRFDDGARPYNDPSDINRLKTELGYELADVYIYLVLLAIRCGCDLEQNIIDKFNIVSQRVGSHHELYRDVEDAPLFTQPWKKKVQ